MGNKIVKLIIAILVLGALTVIFGVWMVWKRPLTIDAWMSRTALKINGLERTKLDTEAGRMTVWEGGSGPTLVLLHGAGDQAGAWARTVGGLVSDHRVVIPDLPGHWKSDPSSGPIHMEQLLDGVARVVDATSPDEPVVIVGNSMGAWLGFLYAHDHPDRVARLVAVNGGPIINPDSQVNIFPKTRDEARETMKGLMGPASPPIPGYVLDDIVRRTADGPAARFAQTAAEMGAYLLDGKLDEVEVPVELVWGAADQLMTLDYARRIADGLPQARLHPIKGCGHVPQRECPLRFLEALKEALAAPPVEPRDSVILSTATPPAGAYPWNDSGPPKPVILSLPGPFGPTKRKMTTRDDFRASVTLKGKQGCLPLQRVEHYCSGKLPACHDCVSGGYVIGNRAAGDRGVDLFQRVRRAKLAKSPPNQRRDSHKVPRYLTCGDPSTHSSDSLAQGDTQGHLELCKQLSGYRR